MTWLHFFASWLLPYYAASKPFRSQIAAGDPNVYSELEKVYRSVKKVEERRHPSHDILHIIGPEALKGFLAEEAELKMKAIPATTPTL